MRPSDNQEQRNTREQIEQTALELFSKKGYQAVSIRDIGKQVGIKESTIYYYFENKQAILDTHLQRIESLIEHMRSQFDHAFEQAEEVSEEAMCEVSVGLLTEYLLHPYVRKLIAILTIEKLSGQQAEELYQRLIYELPLSQQEKVFNKMMERGMIRENDAAVLAQEYYAIILFSFQKNCMGYELTQEHIKTACSEIRRNITDLYRKMR